MPLNLTPNDIQFIVYLPWHILILLCSYTQYFMYYFSLDDSVLLLSLQYWCSLTTVWWPRGARPNAWSFYYLPWLMQVALTHYASGCLLIFFRFGWQMFLLLVDVFCFPFLNLRLCLLDLLISLSPFCESVKISPVLVRISAFLFIQNVQSKLTPLSISVVAYCLL